MARVGESRGQSTRWMVGKTTDGAVVAMVRVVLAAEGPLGVTVAGEKLQEAPAGSPLQAKLTDWLKPFDGDTDSVKALDCPALSIADCGVADTEKSGGGALAPVPVRPICCGEPLALSVIAS